MSATDVLDLPVVLLSHRSPVAFRRDEATGERRVGRGSGGLVTALTGLAGHITESVWVCAATTAEDAVVATEQDGPITVALQPQPHVVGEGPESSGEGPVLSVRLVSVDAAEHDDFYAVIANPLLWFVQHGLYGLAEAPDLTRRERAAFEHGYLPVNDAFADAIIAEVDRYGGRALVMLHDYHFYLVADRVRRSCPDVLMSHFVHIPWPGPDAWTTLPPDMRDRLLWGLLGNDVVAFHTERFARNFLLCAQELLGLPVDLETMTVRLADRDVAARWYPISIDVEALEAIASSDAVAEHQSRLRRAHLGHGRQLLLRVDRTDPSKNIVRGFRAYDTLLSDHPELAGQVTFFALLQPSRQDIPEYAHYLTSIGGIVAEVNARHGREGWQPIDFRLVNDLPLAVAAYSLFDVLLVNALNDGMNLVAKEAAIVNGRDGVLALSENTGAHEELGDVAVTLYPFDIQQQADALYFALTMDQDERRKRRERAAEIVRSNDVAKWFADQLRDLTALNRRGVVPPPPTD